VSPWGAPIHFFRKNGSTLWCCIDYRQLKKITVDRKDPPPWTDDLFKQVKGFTLISKIELCSKYHQIWIKEEDVCKTSFRTCYGNYEVFIFSFVLISAETMFMCLMNNIFQQYLDKFVLIFLDDILIYSRNMEEHKDIMEGVISWLGGGSQFPSVSL